MAILQHVPPQAFPLWPQESGTPHCTSKATTTERLQSLPATQNWQIGKWLLVLMLNSTIEGFVSLKEACTGAAKPVFVYSHRWERDFSTSASHTGNSDILNVSPGFWWRPSRNERLRYHLHTTEMYEQLLLLEQLTSSTEELRWFFGLHSESLVTFIIHN